MEQYLSSASLKSLAKGQLLGKYGISVATVVLRLLCIAPLTFMVSVAIGTNSVISSIISCIATFLVSLFAGFFTAGEALIYLKIACNQRPMVGDLFFCFGKDSKKVFYIQAIISGISTIAALPYMIVSVFVYRNTITDPVALANGVPPVNATLFLIYVILMLLGQITSIVVGIILSQTYYLMLDFPEYSATELMKQSRRLMKGNKGRYFYIMLSFIPLYFLGFLSCGIALLWLYPYVRSTYTNFYLDLIKKSASR